MFSTCLLSHVPAVLNAKLEFSFPLQVRQADVMLHTVYLYLHPELKQSKFKK